MTAPLDNRGLYATLAFEHWAGRTGLIPPEAFLVDRFLDPRASVIEAGTGGGRILFELRRRGFTELHGFDYVPGMIEAARQRDEADAIAFTVQDAVALDHDDASFEQAIYLQQVLSFIECPDGRDAAMREARRVLRPGGTALFSFLCFEARMRNPAYAAFARYLQARRRLRRPSHGIQYQPWLRHGPRRNWRALLDRPPHVYWFRISEAIDALRHAGFAIRAAAWQPQLARGEFFERPERLRAHEADGMIYFVSTAV